MPNLTTELDAVNSMLAGIGQAPVTSLITPDSVDVAVAVNILNKKTKELQVQPWSFNTERKYPLQPDALTKEIYIPENVSSVDISKFAYDIEDVVVRGNKLYSRERRSYEFSSPVEADLVWILPFGELPEVARQYIQAEASVEFQASVLGSQQLDAYLRDQRNARWMAFLRWENDQEDFNLFQNAEFQWMNRRYR